MLVPAQVYDAAEELVRAICEKLRAAAIRGLGDGVTPSVIFWGYAWREGERLMTTGHSSSDRVGCSVQVADLCRHIRGMTGLLGTVEPSALVQYSELMDAVVEQRDLLVEMTDAAEVWVEHGWHLVLVR